MGININDLMIYGKEQEKKVMIEKLKGKDIAWCDDCNCYHVRFKDMG